MLQLKDSTCVIKVRPICKRFVSQWNGVFLFLWKFSRKISLVILMRGNFFTKVSWDILKYLSRNPRERNRSCLAATKHYPNTQSHNGWPIEASWNIPSEYNVVFHLNIFRAFSLGYFVQSLECVFWVCVEIVTDRCCCRPFLGWLLWFIFPSAKV